MSARYSWKGHLKLSLLAVPIKAYPAIRSSGHDIHFHQMHAACHSRINYQKTCPIHGVVKQDEIVSGYEFAKGRYVILEGEELGSVRSAADKIVRIEAFFANGTLDPIYAEAKTYYLVPDGPVAQQAYAVLLKAMRDKKRQALARVVMHRKEELVWLRAIDNVLAITTLNYDDQVAKPQSFAAEIPPREAAPAELALMHTLVDACTPPRFDYSSYQDTYAAKLQQLLDAKIAGQALVSPPVEECAALHNLLDALQKSVADTQQLSNGTHNGTHKKKTGRNGTVTATGRSRK